MSDKDVGELIKAFEEEQAKQYSNPLVRGKDAKVEKHLKFIDANMTIFAQFDTAINKALLELK